VLLAAVLATTVFALSFSSAVAAEALSFTGATAADPSTGGMPDAQQAPGSDPPLTAFASVPLSTPAGTIQSTIYDGANTTRRDAVATFGIPPASTA
jgi:hypothetical protein